MSVEDKVIKDWGRDSLQHKLYLHAITVDEVTVEDAIEATGASMAELFRCLYGYLAGDRIRLIDTRWELRYEGDVREISESELSLILHNDELLHNGEPVPNWRKHVVARFYVRKE